jgi:hypothetical protein
MHDLQARMAADINDYCALLVRRAAEKRKPPEAGSAPTTAPRQINDRR